MLNCNIYVWQRYIVTLHIFRIRATKASNLLKCYSREKTPQDDLEESSNLDELLAKSSTLKNSGETDDGDESSPPYRPWMGLSTERAQQPTQQYAYAYLFDNGRCHLLSNWTAGCCHLFHYDIFTWKNRRFVQLKSTGRCSNDTEQYRKGWRTGWVNALKRNYSFNLYNFLV